jgi:hypothetical protein
MFARRWEVNMGVLRDDFYRVLRRTGERQRTLETEETSIVQTSTANVSNPPTALELTNAFGNLEGLMVAIDVNSGGVNYYLCSYVNGNWVYWTGTKA